MPLRYIIDAANEYIVQDSGNDPMPDLPEGAVEVDARPSPYHDRVGDVWVENTARKTEALSQNARAQRDNKLTREIDPIVTNPLRWADLTTEKQNEWTQYRTDLLNVPQQAGFPNTINWPTKPE
jgi:hypothetical protein